MFIYSTGDGNDTIRGLNETSTLQIAGTYSTKQSGDDIVVTVGKDKITLEGATSLSTVNISGTKSATNSWTLDGTTATYGDKITVTGVKSVSGLKLSGKTVIIFKAALNASKITISGKGYKLKLAKGLAPVKKSAGWTFKKSTATYKGSSTTAG